MGTLTHIGAFIGEKYGSISAKNCYAIGNFNKQIAYTPDDTVDGFNIIDDLSLAKKKISYSEELWNNNVWSIDESISYPYLTYFKNK